MDGRPVKHLFQAEIEERRRLGLCFNCNEKFGRGHNHVCQHIFLIDLTEADDGGDPGIDTPAADEPVISVLAISSVRTRETMQLKVTIGGASLALLDSGSSHNFITKEAATRTDLVLVPQGGMHVTVANGDRVACPGVYHSTPFIEGEAFAANFYARPILWDFGTLRMAFWHRDHWVS